MRLFLLSAMAIPVAACGQPAAPATSIGAPAASASAATPTTAPSSSIGTPAASASAATSPTEPSSWEAKLGQIVTVEGVAQNAKLGALLLIAGSTMIWIDGRDSWPNEMHGKRVRVTGKVIERSDLPVFIQREGEPVKAGMPVPPGTDLKKAARRILLTEVTWNLIGPAR